jgi:CRP-like cAMP-binding protein
MNLLLDRFPKDAQERWHDHSQVLDLDVGAVVAAPGAPMELVYFPMNCMFVVQNQMPNGKTLGVALVGRAGVLGLQALLGTASDNTRAAVLVAGRALRLRAGALRNEFERGGAAQQLLLAYLHIALTHFAQAAFCNRFHSLEGQLCMRLLQMVDMTNRSDFKLTQVEVAELLGTRRERPNRRGWSTIFKSGKVRRVRERSTFRALVSFIEKRSGVRSVVVRHAACGKFGGNFAVGF